MSNKEEDLPTFLMKIRKRYGYSQSDIGEVLGMNYSSYGKYESGQSSLKFEQAEKLAEFYDIPITDFAYRTGSIMHVNSDVHLRRRQKVQLMIELDGTKALQDKAIRLVQSITESINGMSISE